MRKGYQFLGWHTAKSGGYQVEEAAITQDTTLYAQWKKITLARGGISSLKNQASKTLRVKYGKISGASGYQVIYTQDKSFSQYTRVEAGKKRTIDVGGLKKNKTYYVRVRAYALDSAGKRVYGKFSPAVKVTIKK